MPLMFHHAPASWALPIPLAVLIIAIAVLYLGGWRGLSKHSGSVIPFWRAASFFVGLVLIWVAIGSPLAVLDHQFLTAHMVQHLLLMTIAPAFILLGDPVRSFSQGLPNLLALGVVDPSFSWPPLRHLGKFLSNPVVCWLSATAALIAWHVPAIFVLAMQSPSLHSLEHTTFLVAGFLFWWPVIQPWPSVPIWPRWPILLYLFLATIPCDILSAYLTFCDTIVYTSYLRLPLASQLSVLRDQQLAGSLMWACVTIIYLIPAAILTVQLLEQPSRGSPSVTASFQTEVHRS
jgi:putative membrane protein